MEEASLRDFQRHASDYLDSLPIVLTRYGKPILKVEEFSSKKVKTHEDVATDKGESGEKNVENFVEKSGSQVGNDVENSESVTEEKEFYSGLCVGCRKRRQVGRAGLEMLDGGVKRVEICKDCAQKAQETGLEVNWEGGS